MARELWIYFGATMAWSWACWLPMLPTYRREGFASPPWVYALLLLGAFGPTIVAIATMRLRGGKPAVKTLLRKFIIWRVALRWYAVALFLPVVVTLGGALLFAAAGGEIGPLVASRAWMVPVALLAAAPFGPLAEELGWRGFALPGLLERQGPLAASRSVGVAWTLWHTPLFWAPAGSAISGEPVTAGSIGFYLAYLVGYSVFYTWIHLNSGGSVFLAFLLHASFNANLLHRVLPGLWDATAAVERWSLVPLWLLAALVVWRGFPRSSTRPTT
jgi:membrane protease YdiL (CAAX protease family)